MAKKCDYGHTSNGKYKGLEDDEEIVDFVMELLGRRYKKGEIKNKIREKIAPDISVPALEALITAAKKRIRENYRIDPMEYKGYLIEELERFLRNDKTSIKLRLKTIHELAELLGLRAIAETETPLEYAKKVAEAIKQMDASVDGTLIEGDTNVTQEHSKQDEGDGQEEREGETQTQEAGSQTNEV